MCITDFDARRARFRVEESAPFLAMLKRHEGAHLEGGRHKAYFCPAGVLTIGWGHSLEARPVRGLGAGSSISEAEAESLLRADLAELAFLLDTRMPWWRGLGAARSELKNVQLSPQKVVELKLKKSSLSPGVYSMLLSDGKDSFIKSFTVKPQQSQDSSRELENLKQQYKTSPSPALRHRLFRFFSR